MRYLLDTDVCIRFLNGRSPGIREHLLAVGTEDIAMCSVVKGELFYGAIKSQKPQDNVQRLRVFFDRFVSLPFDDAASEAYGHIRTRLERDGTPIGPNDLLIASISIVNGVTLVTNNLREFRRIDDLNTVDWE